MCVGERTEEEFVRDHAMRFIQRLIGLEKCERMRNALAEWTRFLVAFLNGCALRICVYGTMNVLKFDLEDCPFLL
jgi:hypothetical protein